MKKLFILASLLIATSGYSKSIYDLSYEDIKSKPVKMSSYKGKVLLISNTASMCGYTGQYDGLEKLYKKYSKKGLEVIGFPSDSFNQEYKDNKEVAKFCKFKYGVTFPLASVSSVAGKKKNDVFSYLVANAPSEKGEDVSWNFEKFLVDRSGKVVARYPSGVEPESKQVVSKIETLLKQK